jgi:hypothetical protein
MFKRIPSKEERLLGELLESDAAESRPAFSESLHHRVLCSAKQRLAAAPTVVRRWPRGLAVALAAACLLFAVAMGWQLLENAARQVPDPGMPPGPQVTINDLPSIDELADHTVGRLDRLAVSAALEPQKMHLKNDARAVAGMFLDRLPIDPKLLADNR